jgi:deazaflavin-dependent oxidoreductase (nitroreductase family)
MNPIGKKVMAAGNGALSWLYRRTNGRFIGSVKGLPVLLLTVPGRKTGKPRSVPVAYFEHDGGYVLAASAGGAKSNPQWIRNLEAAGQARIRIGVRQYEVDARLASGAEHSELWQNLVLTRAPFFAGYEKKSGRTIPLALLSPTM